MQWVILTRLMHTGLLQLTFGFLLHDNTVNAAPWMIGNTFLIFVNVWFICYTFLESSLWMVFISGYKDDCFAYLLNAVNIIHSLFLVNLFNPHNHSPKVMFYELRCRVIKMKTISIKSRRRYRYPCPFTLWNQSIMYELRNFDY